MAEFKLGRIRFVWKNEWQSSTEYYQDDVVSFGGKAYICVIGHVGQANFFLDLDIAPQKWNLISDGQSWNGAWEPSTEYVYDDIVSYGARLYIANTNHTSSAASGSQTFVVTVAQNAQPPGNNVYVIDGVQYPNLQFIRGYTYTFDQNDSSNITHALNFSATKNGTHAGGTAFENNVRYFLDNVLVADAAAYNAGFTAATTRRVEIAVTGETPDPLYYYCYNHSNMSVNAELDVISLGLTANLSNWDIFAEGLDWKGQWNTSYVYKVNDFVKYGGSTYVCKTEHTSAATAELGLESNQSNWDYFNQGIEYKGEWTAGTRYKVNDLARYGAGVWICTEYHTAVGTPGNDGDKWSKFVEGFQYENDWSSIVQYQSGDVVRYGGNQYISKTSNTGIVPASVTVDWDLFTEGFRFLGDHSASQQYKVGEVVRLGGFTYVCVTDHTGEQPPNTIYWKQINSGFRWRDQWLDDQEYVEGDVVRFGDNSYVCVLAHISEGDDYSSLSSGAEGSRPDLADSGQYWSIIAVGSEQSVLTDIGDLVFFSGTAPTRLPIGQEGQVLRVTADKIPGWEFLQSVENVYYVAEHGEDSPYPEYGSNIDRPFKTIRYATEQIEKGPKNPNAQYLLELNRNFVQREVTAYIRNQVNTATTGSIWENFTYDTVKCERDVGLVIDRIIHDLGQGGNLKTREAAQAFLNVLAQGPYSTTAENNGTGLYGDLASERAQSVESYNYMLTLLSNVLANESPNTVYQNITDDGSTIIDQYINIAIPAEVTALPRVTKLANIVITAISTGQISSIPAREVPQTLVKVSTGKHFETLPIIVPAYCAIMGDELRSTTVFAQGSVIPETDTANTVTTFDRIASVVSSIVTGTSVTPTVGNNELQFTDWPHAVTAQADAVKDLIYLMKYQIDYNLNSMTARKIIDPVGYSSGLENARNNLEVNRKFLIEETIAFLEDEYPTLKYSKTDTRRNAGFVLDALRYDLTYGGNALSIQTGLAYWSGDDNTQPQLPASIKTETIAAFNYLKTTAQSVAGNSAVVNPFQTTVTQTLTGNVGSTIQIGALTTDLIDVLTDGPTAVGTTVTLVDPTPVNEVNTTTALIAAYDELTTNSASIRSSTIAWIDSNYPALEYNSAKYSRDIGIILKAVGFDFMFDSNYQTLKTAHAFLRNTDYYNQYTQEQKTVIRAAIDYALKTLAVANVTSNATAIARVNASADIIDSVIFSATNEGSVFQSQDQNVYYALLQLERNREFIKTEVSAWLDDQIANAVPGSTWENYAYDEEFYLKEVDSYIDALKYDLKYPGNYSSRYVSRYYTNSIAGSREEDMFYLRDGTGLRNCTVNGLHGDLLPANEFGTSRPTAGAYASLDPGFGPDDFTTWIITRSPYVQNVTTFGTAAIGQKIDGALHNGGNDSIVSNDFTQVISDGIGAWITNNGRAELVSVFSYYAHIGYLAEAGGRIRATNGNNSYGDFGSVAEGVDPEETPITAVVDNRTQYSATISNVLTDNVSLLAFEYNHAGNDYTEVKYNIFGPGTGEIIVGDEFRDNGVNHVQVDQDADPLVPIGGSGFLVVSNVAQSGSTTGIFLSATDGNLSSAYPGMKIYIIGGAGIGQYAVIATYNGGSKEATVIRESDGVAGWDHVVPGTVIVAPNSSSTYQIEPRITFTAPTFDNGSADLPTSTTWYDVAYVETAAQYTGVAATGGSGSGLTFDVTRNGSKYFLIVNTPGTGYTRLDAVIVAGTALEGASTVNDITVTITTVNSVTGAVVDFDFEGSGRSGQFLAIGAGTNGALSINGETWIAETLPSTASGHWNSIASGLQNDGSTTFQPSAVVIVANGTNDVAYSTNADTWSSGSLPSSISAPGAKIVAYGNVVGSVVNRFVVISDDDVDVAYSDNGGITWTVASAALPQTGFTALTYGAGKFVAIASGSTAAAYSTDGVTWTTVTLPANAAGNVVWGNGKFVTLGGTNGTMYSLDGITWIDNALYLPLQEGGNAGLSAPRKIAYGQGVFVVTASYFDNIVQYSTDGVYWQAYNLGASVGSGGLNAVAFGNPARDGRFVMLLNDVGLGAAFAKIGATARGRASVSNEQIFEVRITEPGSGYTTLPSITVTDPNNIDDVVLVPQLGKGSLANPTFINRGNGYSSSSAEVDSTFSNGFADFPQNGTFIAVRRLTQRPVPGSNVEFSSLPGQFFKLVTTVSFLGTTAGSFTGFLQLSPGITVTDTLPDGAAVELRIRFSQVRLTGHDFLDIGTGNFVSTNYPNTPLQPAVQLKETTDSDGGRVFFTATDQDGNFRVGDLFSIEQSTGVATLNADAFNIAGLQELSLGEVTLGGNSASISEFSTDPFFTANSDNVVPTQRAVKAFIESQIGGGGASLNVNSVTAGDIFIGSDTITTLSGSTLNIRANVVFSGTVLGLPLAYNYFLR